MKRPVEIVLGVLASAQQARADLTQQSRELDDFQKILEIRARKMQARYGVPTYSFDEFEKELPLEKPKSLLMRLAEGGFKAIAITAAVMSVAVLWSYLVGGQVMELAKPVAEWSNKTIGGLIGVGAFTAVLGAYHTVQADDSVQVKHNNLERYNEYLDQTELTLSKQNQKARDVDVQMSSPARSVTHFRDMIVSQESVSSLQTSR